MEVNDSLKSHFIFKALLSRHSLVLVWLWNLWKPQRALLWRQGSPKVPCVWKSVCLVLVHLRGSWLLWFSPTLVFASLRLPEEQVTMRKKPLRPLEARAPVQLPLNDQSIEMSVTCTHTHAHAKLTQQNKLQTWPVSRRREICFPGRI